MTAYCYENVTFCQMSYLTKRCFAAAELWPGDGANCGKTEFAKSYNAGSDGES